MKNTIAFIVLLSSILSGCAGLREYQLEQQRKFDDRIYYSAFLPYMAEICSRDIAFKGFSNSADCNRYQYRHEIKERISRLRKEVEGLNQEQIEQSTQGNIEMGMSFSAVKLSMGNPDKINNTTTKYGTSSQWVYEDIIYVYFEDGKVTAWQDY